ncbi:MAG: hypothetical protein ABIN92_01050, partial [Ferruginibacter sp.]
MKIFFALFTFLFIQKNVFAQTENIADSSIAGIWKGKIITTDKHLPYEIAISEAGGKLTGYSYTTYTVNSVEMVAVRTLKVKNDNGNITTIDDDLLFENFDKTSPKQFKQTNTLTLKVSGNMMSLTGNFTTKKTKNFRALTGEIALTKENDLSKTAVASKLEEMKLLAAMSFVKQPEPVEEDHPLLTKKIIDVRNYLPVKIVHQLAVTAPYIKRIPILPVTVDIAKTVKKPIVEIPEKQTAVAPPAKRNVQPKPVTAKPTP